MAGIQQKKTATVNPVLRQLTNDDTKILGKSIDKKREKHLPLDKFVTRNYKHLNSAWTPINHKPSNETIYKERRELVCNWFTLWTDSQRKRFLDLLFHHCRRSQLHFIWQWFDEKVPLKHVDFTKVLPRFLSLYIFSFLDPRSLCRAAMVSWHWKFFTEQDVLWMAKCVRQGWYLPYTPANNEYGAYKLHYVACIKTLDMNVPSKEASALYGTLGDGKRKKLLKKLRGNSLKAKFSSQVLESRPAWQNPDVKPQDLDRANTALLHDLNPNDPKVHEALLMHHNKFGIVKASSKAMYAEEETPRGIEPAKRSMHRALKDFEEDAAVGQWEGKHGNKHLLSEKLELEKFEEKRLMELVHQPWEPPAPAKRNFQRRSNLSGGGDYPLPWQHNQTQAVSKSYPSQAHPRVIFISSRVPAADVLVDAVMFGVIPIVYEYEGTTLESLMSRLDRCLQGRNAQSVGFFAHQELRWEIRLVHGNTVTVDNLDEDVHVEFFETIANFVLPPEQGGHIDMFLPLGACENGVEMLTQLEVLTGMTFTCPTGIVGNYNHVNSDWLKSPEQVPPPSHYFCASKLNVWANTADQAQEACAVTKKHMARYFEQKHKDVVSQLVGQVVFDALGQVDISGLKDVTETLTDGLITLGKEQNVSNTLEYLGQYLLEKAAAANQTYAFGDGEGTLSPAKTMPAATLTNQLRIDEQYDTPSEVDEDQQKTPQQKIQRWPDFDKTPRSGSEMEEDIEDDVDATDREVQDLNFNNSNAGGGEEGHEDNVEEEIIITTEQEFNNNNSGGCGDEEAEDQDESITEEEDFNCNNSNNDKDIEEEKTEVEEEDLNCNNNNNENEQEQTKPQQSARNSVRLNLETPRTPRTARGSEPYGADTLRAYSMAGDLTSRSAIVDDVNCPRTMRARDLVENPDKRRTLIAKEVLASEVTYMRTLEVIKNSFYTPLTNALASNRGVVSAHNLQIIFADILNILALSRSLTADLRSRLSDWGPHQCLGDIFVKFSAQLNVYVNFLNNYPVILITLERCLEQVPLFRAFLRRHERTPETKMLSLSELFLSPTRRVSEWVDLLTWFHANTPKDHADRGDLEAAVFTVGQLATLIRECKLRGERERQLVAIQEKILHSPVLLEANRFFIKQLDAAHLKPPSEAIALELRTYQHIETLGLFLFNDSLVVTRRTSKHLPFERCVDYNYRFEACAALHRLRVDDIPDSKYVKNAFRMYTPKRSWTCAADDYDDKLNWVSLLENTVRAALNM